MVKRFKFIQAHCAKTQSCCCKYQSSNWLIEKQKNSEREKIGPDAQERKGEDFTYFPCNIIRLNKGISINNDHYHNKN